MLTTRREGQKDPFPVEQPTGEKDKDTERLEGLGKRIAEFVASYIWGERRHTFGGNTAWVPGLAENVYPGS